MKGKLIVFEGIDSSGKATQQKLLIESLKAMGFEVEALDFPRYSKFFGSLVGRYLSGEFGSMEELSEEFCALLYSLDRYQIKKEIEQKLVQGKVLVANRYVFSNIAHQSAKFHNPKEQKKFLRWIECVESRMPKADLVFLLDLPVPLAVSLMKENDRQKAYRHGKERDIHENNELYLQRVRELYLQLAHKNKDWILVNCASNSALNPKEEIAKEILEEAKSVLK